MKNKNILIGVAVVAVVALGAYLVINKTVMLPSLGSKQTSIKALLAAGTNQNCTFTTTNGESSSSGEVFITAGKLRGDFTSVTAGKTTKSHMIVSNDIAYVWIEEPLQGFRMSFESMGNTKGDAVDPSAETNYTCRPWNAEESKFSLPETVNFQDMTAMMKQAAQASTSLPKPAGTGTGAAAGANIQSYAEQQCAACDMVSDATAKAQCKASFDCR